MMSVSLSVLASAGVGLPDPRTPIEQAIWSFLIWLFVGGLADRSGSRSGGAPQPRRGDGGGRRPTPPRRLRTRPGWAAPTR